MRPNQELLAKFNEIVSHYEADPKGRRTGFRPGSKSERYVLDPNGSVDPVTFLTTRENAEFLELYTKSQGSEGVSRDLTKNFKHAKEFSDQLEDEWSLMMVIALTELHENDEHWDENKMSESGRSFVGNVQKILESGEIPSNNVFNPLVYKIVREHHSGAKFHNALIKLYADLADGHMIVEVTP